MTKCSISITLGLLSAQRRQSAGIQQLANGFLLRRKHISQRQYVPNQRRIFHDGYLQLFRWYKRRSDSIEHQHQLKFEKKLPPTLKSQPHQAVIHKILGLKSERKLIQVIYITWQIPLENNGAFTSQKSKWTEIEMSWNKNGMELG